MEDVKENILRIERRSDGVAVVWVDVPGEKVNVFREGFEKEFEEVFDELEADPALRGVVIASAKEDSFSAGADVKMLRAVEQPEDAEELSRIGQEVMNRIAGFPDPVVAAIHGACLGGGLELALACHGRVASDYEKTRLGLPEVMLGVIPGTGGTQRLPRVVGLERALDLILTGKQIPAGYARSMGLVDEVVHPAILIEVAAEHALGLTRPQGAAGVSAALKTIGRAASVDRVKAFFLEDNPAGRKLVFNQARKKVLARTRGNMPAPLRAIEVIRTGLEDGMEAGLRAERKAFGELAASSEAKNLMALFFAREALKKERGAEAEPRQVRKIGVLGAGLMGSGIGYITAYKAGLPVRLKDVDVVPLRSGLRSIRKTLERRAAKKRMPDSEVERIMHLIRPTTGYTGFGQADVVIEAVVEDLAVKQQVLQEVEEAAPEAIFASNTSSIPISRIAEAAERPEQVVGMHYFSPVDRVPLLEVIAGEKTAPEVVATCVELGKRQGKIVIVVNDGAGFYTTRILAPYFAEAAHLLSEGVPIDRIDRALVEFGFPVGPFHLLDEVGIDVGQKIQGILHEAFGERMAPVQAMDRIVEDGRFGKKNGMGFYTYRPRGEGYERRDEVDESVYALLGVRPTVNLEPEKIALRCTLAMVNEAVRCYEEGILRSARDGDVGAVFGLGFPPFLGGPFRFIDSLGTGEVLELLEDHRLRLGERFAPAKLIRRMAEQRQSFHGEEAPLPGQV